MSKFKVGDKVKINKKIISFKYGKGGVTSDVIGKIIGVREDNEYYVDFPSVRCWHGLEKELELVEETYTYEDLKKSPIGTKITFESGNTLIKIDEDYYREAKSSGICRNIMDLKELKDKHYCFLNQGKIIKIEEPTYKIVYEVKPEILDEAEKKYLRSVIKPFKEKVTYISKLHTREDKEFISINLKNGDYIDLPLFKENTMYKKLIINKDYTLKELGL